MSEQTQQTNDLEAGDEDKGQAIRPVSNDAVEAKIRKIFKQINSHAQDRTTANESITALRDELVNKGFTKKAQRVVEMFMKLNEDEQQFFWMAVEIMLKALGKPMQTRLELVSSTEG